MTTEHEQGDLDRASWEGMPEPANFEDIVNSFLDAALANFKKSTHLVDVHESALEVLSSMTEVDKDLLRRALDWKLSDSETMRELMEEKFGHEEWLKILRKESQRLKYHWTYDGGTPGD